MDMDTSQLAEGIVRGDFQSLARAITWVENELPGYETLLKALSPVHPPPIIGFTGPPGAGKSTLINGLASLLSGQGKKVAVVAVDPTSPFNLGSLLADRLRMSERFTDPSIFIRSVATRGSLGGLSEKIIEITDVLKAAPFDLILVETVGVGQSEVEIAGLADMTVVVVVPEAGDDIQTLKSGIMEIADVFVVNKSDREGATQMAANLERLASYHAGSGRRAVLQTSAGTGTGLQQLAEEISSAHSSAHQRKHLLLAEKLYRIIRKKRMKDVSIRELAARISESANQGNVNIYKMAEEY